MDTVWFADEMGNILQSIATTCDDLAAMAHADSDSQLLWAYQAGFHAALRSIALALDIPPPRMVAEYPLPPGAGGARDQVAAPGRRLPGPTTGFGIDTPPRNP